MDSDDDDEREIPDDEPETDPGRAGRVPLLQNIVKVVSGEYHGLALTADVRSHPLPEVQGYLFLFLG